ncbi:unnamed protein product [Auanema sp. JU1783]|nr:unnamed protein product [Auanema sp. JU1783]
MLVIFLLCLLSLTQAEANEDAKTEFKSFFKVQDGQLDSVSSLLLRMKKLAHRRVYGNRVFGNDAVEDSKKEVTISESQPAVVKEVSPYLFEGDIFLSKKQAVGILQTISHIERRKRKDGRDRRSFVAEEEEKWLELPIKYKFHESLDFHSVRQIISAIRYWENVTCLSFLNAPDAYEDEDHLEFFRGQGCYSMIGRNGGRQGVSIGENCLGVIEHEIGHALGLWHQQSRPDAQTYVKVQEDFILPSFISDFQTRENDINTLGVPYDLGSVMHYGSTAFSSDQNSKTLITRDPLYQSTIGQRETLSFLDIETINTAYCKEQCSSRSAGQCKNGGYPHPGKCSDCLCPNGLSGKSCEEPEASQNAECGQALTLSDEWQEFNSPDFPDPGYEPNQKCSWLLSAGNGKRIELEFIEDFSFLCTTTCVDYVELKISKDLRNTGFRFCCYDMPTESLISESNKAIVIFKSSLSSDIGFKLRVRHTDLPSRTTPAPVIRTTTPVPTTIAGTDIWSEWGEWSQCSRSCGGCGIKSRARTCRTKDCDGRRQEFSTCNMEACPVDKHCAKLLSTNRLCNGVVCTKVTSALSGCNEPQCCPPFYNNKGVCMSDSPISNDFIV